MKVILVILLPTTFPTAIPPEPAWEAMVEATNSGRVVLRETRVSPITRSETPMRRATSAAAVTKYSLPFHSKMNPMIMMAA